MPSSCIENRDHLCHRYLDKRILFLTAIADALILQTDQGKQEKDGSMSSLHSLIKSNEDISVIFPRCDKRKPVVQIRPSFSGDEMIPSLSSSSSRNVKRSIQCHFVINLHVTVEEKPVKSNVLAATQSKFDRAATSFTLQPSQLLPNKRNIARHVGMISNIPNSSDTTKKSPNFPVATPQYNSLILFDLGGHSLSLIHI